ncbi:MAG: hypothetical protein D6B28_01680 [Gammaproteobacteria bacterium]|nr:MAG: hypothetical protein D6B28_01680 [Gammaproteobacteria bacterium]
MDKDDINDLFTGKDPGDIVRMTAEIARKLTIIYESDFGYKGLYFCMIGITATDKTSCKSTEDYLQNILVELDKHSDTEKRHLSTIKSMLYATQASICDSTEEIFAKCLDSIEHALAAAAETPDIYENIHYCIELWQRKSQNFTMPL